MIHIVDTSEVLLELGIFEKPLAEERAVVTTAILKAEGFVRAFLGYDPCYLERTEYYPQQNYQAQHARSIWEVTEQRAVLRQVSEAATSELQLRHLPIRGEPRVEVSIDYDGRGGSKSTSFGAGTAKVLGQDFWPNYDCQDSDGQDICRDGILRALGLWPTTAGSVRVTYTAGYKPKELRGNDTVLDASPIWSAVLQESARRARKVLAMKKSDRLGLLSGIPTSENLGEYSYSMDSQVTQQLFGGMLSGEIKEMLQPFVNLGYALG